MILIGTHSGSFHADDALGTATLRTIFPAAEVVRSRDPKVWADCDALVDVGGEYDALRNRFDHHQKGFAERRANGIPYAGAGLVWKHYGTDFVQHVCPGVTREQAAAVALEVDTRLVQHADAVDSGIAVQGPAAFSLTGIIDTLNATWQEGDAPTTDDDRFRMAVNLAKTVLTRLVQVVAAEHAATAIVRAAPTLADGRILVLDVSRLPYDKVVCAEYPDVRFVVYPESSGGQWQVRVVPKVLGTFEARADLPQSWAGLRDADLAKLTGVEDAVFCHNGRFICGAKTKDGALKLASLAVAAL